MRRPVSVWTRCSSCGSTRCIPVSATSWWTCSTTTSSKGRRRTESGSSASIAISAIPTASCGCAAFRTWNRRKVALTNFYSGPIWKAHGRVAAGTMVDSDNVLLLRPLRPDTVFAPSTVKLPPPGTRGPGKGLLVASIVYVERNTPSEFGEFFAEGAAAALGAGGRAGHRANGERAQPEYLPEPAGARARERVRLVHAVRGPGSGRQAAARARAVDAVARRRP